MCPDTETLFPTEEIKNANLLGALQLAFIGDAAYELLVRNYVLSQSSSKVQDLHKASIGFANADFQAQAGEKLLPVMTEEEKAVYRRGRNAHSAHTPKNKSAAQYHRATAFEAVIGKLYLDGNYKRLHEFFDIITEKTDG